MPVSPRLVHCACFPYNPPPLFTSAARLTVRDWCMVLGPLRLVKHAIIVLALLIGGLCALELTLQYRASTEQDAPLNSSSVARQLCPSPTTHHQLHPCRPYTFRDPRSGQDVTWRTNSFGLREAEPAVPKPAGVLRILFLGDEQTLAGEIESEQLFTTQVRAQLQQRSRWRIETINAGAPGYCPLLSLLQLKHSLATLQPDFVLMCVDNSDVADDRHWRPRLRIADDGSCLACVHPELDAPPRKDAMAVLDRFELPKWGLRQLLSSAMSTDAASSPVDYAASAGSRGSEVNTHAQQAASPLIEINRMVTAMSGRFLIVRQPRLEGVAATALEGKSQATPVSVTRFYEVIDAIATRDRVPYCDAVRLSTKFNLTEASFDVDTGLLNVEGHFRLAQMLSQFIVAFSPQGIWLDQQVPNGPAPYNVRGGPIAVTGNPTNGAEQSPGADASVLAGHQMNRHVR